MRIALAQINPTIGDVAGNTAKILGFIDRAKAEMADVVVFPELAVTGYPPKDLLLKPELIAGCAEAIEKINHGMRLDPNYTDIRLHWLAQAYFQLGQYGKAVDLLERRLILKPDTDISRVLLAACYGHLGQLDEAKTQWAEAFRINPEYSLEHRMKVLPYKDPTDFDRVVEGLRKAGLIE